MAGQRNNQCMRFLIHPIVHETLKHLVSKESADLIADLAGGEKSTSPITRRPQPSTKETGVLKTLLKGKKNDSFVESVLRTMGITNPEEFARNGRTKNLRKRGWQFYHRHAHEIAKILEELCNLHDNKNKTYIYSTKRTYMMFLFVRIMESGYFSFNTKVSTFVLKEKHFLGPYDYAPRTTSNIYYYIIEVS